MMTETDNPPAENPYAAPSAEAALPARNLFQDIPTKELKTLRNDSHTIRAVVALMALGLLIMFAAGGLILSQGGEHGLPGAFELIPLMGISALNLAALVGLVIRGNWGRILGFVSGVLMLIGFPIGTLIGVLFLISLGRSKRLFGPDRLIHKQLEAEWKYRKKNRVE